MLARAYYNPDVILEAGLDPILRGLMMQPQAKVEPRWSLSVSGNFLGESTVNGKFARCFVPVSQPRRWARSGPRTWAPC